jgi:hypothetical protein
MQHCPYSSLSTTGWRRMRNGSRAPPITSSALRGGAWSASLYNHFTPWESAPGPIWEAGCSPDRVWNLWRWKNLLHLPGNDSHFLDRPSCSLFTVQTELSQIIILIITVKLRTMAKNFYLLEPVVIIIHYIIPRLCHVLGIETKSILT